VSWRLDYTREARKGIRAIRDKTLLRRLNAALLALQDDPRPAGAVKLAGNEDHWCVRVGDWRVVYRI
jgi:mRNA interferase RelE/StbE